MKILLVEDNQGDARLIREMLGEGEAEQFDLLHVESLAAASKCLNEMSVDVVLLDLSLPDSHGLDTFNKIHTQVPASPIVVLSGFADEAFALEAVRQGAQDYLTKGKFDGNQLARSMRYAIERQRIENALKQSEEKLHTTFESITDAIVITDTLGSIVQTNEAATRMTGYSREEIIGKSGLDLIDPKYHDMAVQTMMKVLEEGHGMESMELQFLTKDGKHVDAEFGTAMIRDTSGKPAGFVSIARDITERKRARDALRESEVLYRSLVEHLPQRIFIKDHNGVYLSCNDNYARDLRIAAQRIVGKDDFAFYPPELANKYRADDQEVMVDGKPKDTEEKYLADGEERWVHTVKVPYHDDQGQVIGVLGIFEDITERKRAEAALRESEGRYRALVETSPDGITLSDLNGNIVMANQETAAMHGFASVEEMVGNGAFDLIAPEDRPRALENVRKTLEMGSVRDIEYTLLRRDGSRFLGELSAALISDAQGKPQAFMAITRDITEHRRLEEQFRQAQKMEAVGRLAGGVAHDFNNLLTVINLYSSLALSSLNAADPLRHDLGEILKAGERAAALTRQLLAFGRRQTLEMRVLNLNEVLEGLNKMLPRLIGEDIAVKMSLAPGLGRTRADPGQIEQVVVNLVVNARDAMPEGGTLIIKTSNAPLDETYVSQHAEAPGDYVLLAISDTGTGMSAEVKAHLFEPFFTTKGVGKGTGLGLATAYGIVKQHQGHISVHSEPGQGTTFRVYLPRVKEEAEVSAPTGKATAMPGGSETVLVAEDERAVRGIAVRILQELGYTVLEAANGTEALEVALAHGEEIALLLSDVIMPEMNGKALAERLAVRWPGLKVLFVSGYTDETIAHQGILDKGAAFLQKPFGPEALARKVREVLDEGKGAGVFT